MSEDVDEHQDEVMIDNTTSTAKGEESTAGYPSASATTTSTTTSKKRKTKPQTTLSSFTIRKPAWSYITLKLITPSQLSSISGSRESTKSSDQLDAVTVHLHLQAALRQFLGLHGTAIPFDILKIDEQTVWTRVSREDASAVVAAVGGWVGKGGEGWRVVEWGCWGPRGGENGRDLFS